MNISYWIIIIVIYLLSLWIRKRIRRRTPSEFKEHPPSAQEGRRVKEAKGLPEWAKLMGFVDLSEEEVKEPKEMEPEEEIPKSRTLKEEIEVFDELTTYAEPVTEAETTEPEMKVPDLVSEEEIEKTLSIYKKPKWVLPEVRVQIHIGRFGDLIYDVDSLRDLIVLREILGPPRAIQRYRSRSHF